MCEVRQPRYDMNILANSEDIDVFKAHNNAWSTEEYFVLLSDFSRDSALALQNLAFACEVEEPGMFQKRVFEIQKMLLAIGAVDLLWEAEKAAKMARRGDWIKSVEWIAAVVATGVRRLCKQLRSAEIDSGTDAPETADDESEIFKSKRILDRGAFKRKRILAVDDQPEILVAVNAILKDEYDVFAANTHMLALNMLAHKDPDLILLDIKMPDKNGFQLLGIIRRIRGYEKTPVIFLTGDVSADNVRMSMLSGGNDFIKKPIEPKTLLSKIHMHIGGGRSAESDKKHV